MEICDLYGRVSTQEQADNGYSLKEQETRLRAFAEAHGWAINAVYMDGGFSGASLHRPGIQNVIKDAQERKVSKVVVYKIDRLSRSQKDTLSIIEDSFTPNGVSFVSMVESFDTGTAFGMAMIGILSVFAQLERETIKERMIIGRDARIKSGKYKGSGTIPIGFSYEDGNLSLVEYDAMVVRSCYEMFADGASANAIARKMNTEYNFRQKTWTANKVKRLLANPIYIGIQRWKGAETEVENCPKIVPYELWNNVQREIARRDKKQEKPQSAHRHTTMLGGILWCGECGQRYTAEPDRDSSGKRIYRYYCYGRVKKRHKLPADPCSNRSWRAEELDEIIIDELRKLKDSLNFVSDDFNEQVVSNEKEKALKSHIKDLEKAQSRLLDLYAFGKIPASKIKTKLEDIDEEIEKAKKDLSGIAHPAKKQSRQETEKLLEDFGRIVDEARTDEELYNIVHKLIQSVTLTGDDVEINWNI